MEYTAKGALQTPLQQARDVGGGADTLLPSQLVYSREDLAIVIINILKCVIHTNLYIITSYKWCSGLFCQDCEHTTVLQYPTTRTLEPWQRCLHRSISFTMLLTPVYFHHTIMCENSQFSDLHSDLQTGISKARFPGNTRRVGALTCLLLCATLLPATHCHDFGLSA